MVIVWNDLASGSPEFTAILVCLNSLFQILFYSPYAYLFLSVILPACNLPNTGGENVSVSFGLVATSVGIYLGIPFAIGFGSWVTCNKLLTHPGWKIWYKTVFIPRTAPLTLVALLFTIIIMFVLKGHLIVSIPLAVLRVSLPLCSYFGLMFVGVYYLCHRLGYGLEETITLSFTSASNNFELAIAVSIAVFGLDSAEAFVGVIGPLVEVPVMLGFVHLVQVLHRRWPTVSHAHRSSITSAAGNEVVDADGTDVSRAVDCEIAVSPLHARNVLFLCTGNSCRSHMAQGWCWYYHPHITAYSAGTAPTPGKPGTINPLAMQVMLEFGIDLSGHRSKHIQDLSAVDFALVVTVCDDAAQECPTFTPTRADAKPPRVVHHAFDDPPRLVGAVVQDTARDAEQQLQVYRRVCEEIRDFVRDELPTLLL
jgi:protein-tyrosine-phosphatase/predicted Na+-dependent transporter